VDTKLDAFWSAWQQLSSDTANASLRQQVISTGQSLANTLQPSSKQISDLRNSLDQSVQDSVGQVNTLVQTIAKLNASAAQSPNDPSIADQQDSAVAKLSGLIDISVIRSGGVVEVTTRAGNSLVTGTHASSLSLNVNGSGGTSDQLLLDGTDITSQVKDGAIGGALQARDTALPALQGRLDVLANSITSAVNTAYGGNFFIPLSQVAGSASAISVALTDPTLLQTGTSGDAGDNSIVNAVAALATQPVVSGVSASEYQSQTVFQLGNEIANAQADSEASQSIISQMNNQHAAISGVSLDQEAANLMQFERSYQAAARVINTVDQMMQTAIGLGANVP
jgi:flagellar hook-associated protein 1 FlgK